MNQKIVNKAIRDAKKKIRGTRGFADLSKFEVIEYTAEELRDLGEESVTWVGQYAHGSVDSDRGLTLMLNVDAHATEEELSDTIRHEVGHGLWELLEEEGRRRWLEEAFGAYGPEEEFADHFMFLTGGRAMEMAFRELFMELTKP